MATEANIQRHVNKGFGKAAKKLGHTFVQFRPRSTGTVLINDNIVREQMLAFDRGSGFPFTEPVDYNVSKYYALADLTFVKIGDYFWDYADRIFFVANIEPIKPAELMLCNRTISLYTPAGVIGGYGGDTDPVLKLSGWPVSMISGTKGESNEAKTPGSIRAPWEVICLPFFPGVTIDEYDLVIDDLDRRFIVSQTSLAKEGWYLTCSRENS